MYKHVFPRNLNLKALITSLLFFYSVVLNIQSVYGQTEAPYQSVFQSDSLFRLNLRTDFSKIFSDRYDSTSYHSGVLSYLKPNGDSVLLNVRLKVRGVFRKDPANCEFPPLWVNFKKEEVKGTIFENQNKLKLVTPCQFERYILQEYIIYKLYNQITDVSFRVRLVKVNYITSVKNKSLYNGYSFFIEDNKQMAERNKMKITEKFFTPYQLDRNAMTIVGLFEFMIGNKDWFVTSHHNMTLLVNDSIKIPIPVPHDFDMSELIDPEYRKPKGVPEESLVSTQVYKGICMTPEEQRKAFQYFEDMKNQFNATIQKDPYMSKPLKNQVIGFLKRFYGIIEDPELVQTEILLKCDSYKNYNIPSKK
jgi:hypothetical protein